MSHSISNRKPPLSSRRHFLTAAGGVVSVSSALRASPQESESGDASASTHGQNSRVRQMYDIRVQAARSHLVEAVPKHVSNGDEAQYQSRVGNFSKGLPHDQHGEVDPNAYDALLRALSTGDPEDFEQIPMGGTIALVDPQAGFAFDLEGVD